MLAYAGNVNTTPQSYQEARYFGKWQQWETAMKEELSKIESDKVWEVVNKLPNQRVVDGEWVCTKKIDGATEFHCAVQLMSGMWINIFRHPVQLFCHHP
jgi:hypothetical protein